MEELREVANALNERERELNAAIGIAKMLVEKRKQTFAALEEAKEQTETVSRVLRAHQQEIQILREALLDAEERHEKTSALLSDAEEAILKLTGESQHYEEHLRTLQRQHCREDHDSRVEEMESWLAQQRQAFHSKS